LHQPIVYFTYLSGDLSEQAMNREL